MTGPINILHGIENFPKHILEALEGKTAGDATYADIVAFISGSYAVVVQTLQTVAKDDLNTLKTAMVSTAETTYAATSGDTADKIKAAAAAALATGVALVAGDLKDAFSKISAALLQNLLHTLATDAGNSVSVSATA